MSIKPHDNPVTGLVTDSEVVDHVSVQGNLAEL